MLAGSRRLQKNSCPNSELSRCSRAAAASSCCHLGEVLVAEAHLKLADAEGYGMVVGRDLEHAMAMVLIDAAAVVLANAILLGDSLIVCVAWNGWCWSDSYEYECKYA